MRFGPWVQPDDDSFPFLVRRTAVSRVFSPSALAGSTAPPTSTSTSTVTDSDAYLLSGKAPDDVDVPSASPPLPPGAVGWDYEAEHGTLLGVTVSGQVGLTGIDSAAPDGELAVRGDLRRASSYLLDSVSAFGGADWPFPSTGRFSPTPGSVFAGYTLLDQWFGSGSNNPFEDFSFFFDVDDLDADRWLVLAAGTGHYIDGTDASMTTFQAAAMAVRFLRFDFNYRPPRVRPMYDELAPLRQFPRGDNLVGTGGSRQRGAGSRQASNRQGWNGTYLRAAPKTVDFMGESETSGPRVCNHSRAYRPPG